MSLILCAAPFCHNNLLQMIGVVSYKLLAALLGVLAHSLLAMDSSSVMFLGLRTATAFFRSHHKFLIRLMSGDCDVHS